MRSVVWRTATLAATAVVAAAVAVPAQAGTDGVPPGQRGRLLTERPLTNAAALPSAAVNRLVTYTSEGVGGRKITVSGTVSIPKGRPPRGGWPVISWAHGTTGTADVCAPSRDTNDGPAHDYVSFSTRYLDKFVARGYAVVQTDYEGLGTPGGHPYMHGVSEANTVADIVRAARRVDPRIGRDWYVIGHSQGGQAALYTAAARQQPRDVRLKGAVALAPGSFFSQTPAYVQGQLPGAQAALPFLFVLLNGAQAADPSFNPEELLTAEATELLRAGRTSACTAQLAQMGRSLPLDKVFRPGADLGPFVSYLESQEPLGLTLKVPTMVAQGSADTLVPTSSTDAVVGDLCRRYQHITYRHFEGADHRGLIDASFEQSVEFIKDLQAGRTPQSTC